MARRIKLANHLSEEELGKRYRSEKEAVARSHWQLLWLLSRGKSTAEVAEVTGYCQDWIGKLVRKYNAMGEAGVEDERRGHSGRPRLLSSEQDHELKIELERAEASGSAWNSVQTAAWMSQKLGRRVRPNRGLETLHRLGFSAKTPRPRHAKADVVDQEVFKKNVS